MWQHRAKVESSHIQCLAATLGVLKQPFICIISLHILFPNYIKEHKRQVSFRLSLGAARYLAKECDKDRKSDHRTALSHHSKTLREQAEACPLERNKCRRGDSLCHSWGPILTEAPCGMTSPEPAIH